MPGFLVYGIALAGLGGASGIEVFASRYRLPLDGTGKLIASLAGLADIVLIIGAFFALPIMSALGAIAIGAVGTAVIAKIAPDSTGAVVIATLIGAAAAYYFIA